MNDSRLKKVICPFRRLLEIAGKMHCWIFLNIGDEYKAYDECGLTDEENHVLGSRGTYCVETAEPPKEDNYETD